MTKAYAFDTPVGRYYSTPDGTFPSVTTIIDQTLNPGKAAGLRAWHAKDPEAAEADGAEARAKGQLVHDIAEMTFSGNGTPDLEGLPPDVHVSAMSLVRTVNLELTEVWQQEQVIWSAVYGYAGRLDMVGVWRGNPCVVDFKTGKKKRYRSYFNDYFSQVAAYAIAWNERNPDADRIQHGAIFHTVHGFGCQPPHSVDVAEWRGDFLRRLGLFRRLAATGNLHRHRNW